MNRREFVKTAAVGLAAAPAVVRAQSGQKIRMGFIGIGNRGSHLLRLFMEQPDVEAVALCDVYEPYLNRDRNAVAKEFFEFRVPVPKMDEKFTVQPKRYSDYRKLLEDKNVDAVCIGTPDHWHAIQTIDAIRAGKDVYVEKPLTATIVEGRTMVKAQAASKQVVAVGLNRRGCPAYQRLAKEIASGKYGEFIVGRAARVSNMFPNGIGRMQPSEPPAGFDWDAWLGPRAMRPYKFNTAPYFFRWHGEFSSQMGNWGVHYMDAIRWMMGETAPCAVTANGGQYLLKHDGDIPDTMEVAFEFASKKIVNFSIYEACGGAPTQMREIELRGNKATIFADECGYNLFAAKPGQFQKWKSELQDMVFNQDNGILPDGSGAGSTLALIRNFLECVKTRGVPLCPLEEGHRSTSFAHLANIALKMGRRLEWDAVNERFTNCEKANDLLHYDYRKGYSL